VSALTLEQIAVKIATAEAGLASATTQYDRNVCTEIIGEYRRYADERAKEKRSWLLRRRDDSTTTSPLRLVAGAPRRLAWDSLVRGLLVRVSLARLVKKDGG
jgi:hypothetical protein